MLCLTVSFLLTLTLPCSFTLNFLFNSFRSSDLSLIDDARIVSPVLHLTNDSNQFSFGRAFYPSPIQMVSSFSTSFVFSILPEIQSSPGFGLTFVLSNTTTPPGSIAGQYFGLFTNSTVPIIASLIAVEFDVGQNPEFNDPDGNHVGIDLNNVESAETQTAGYYSSSDGYFIPVDMRNGQNVRAWIEFDGQDFEFNITIAPIDVHRPSRPLLTYRNPEMANYISSKMFVGFSASKTTWVESQRILAWSLSDTGPARDLNTKNLPELHPKKTFSLSTAGIVGIIASIVFTAVAFLWLIWYLRKKRNARKEGVEEWELEYWPHRFTFEELDRATNGFSKDALLGSGGFGKVYRGSLKNADVAVKCVSHDSKQGLREFMAEISSIGRLQHKNLVQMRGWCRKNNELMLVYDYMPNGSLNRWIFDEPKTVMNWAHRKRVLADIAEGLNYLHHGWDQIVVHRDIKSSNILLDSDMRGRLGDFGLAKLYRQGESPSMTRLVGTLGYLAPELATVAVPTSASDVYSFGVVLLEVACGRRPLDMRRNEDEQVLIEWACELYRNGKLCDAADRRMECGIEDVDVILKLGLACCHPDPIQRPTMKEIVAAIHISSQ